jgi:hypothetical protein
MSKDFREDVELIKTAQSKILELNSNIVKDDYVEQKSGNKRIAQIINVAKSDLTTLWITSKRINMRLGFKSELYLLNQTMIDNSSLRKITDNENKLSFKSLEEFVSFIDTMKKVEKKEAEKKEAEKSATQKSTTKKRTNKKSETKTV